MLFFWYPHCFAATVVSISGCACAAGGIAVFFSGESRIAGIALIIIGALLMLWASKINDNKAFKRWLKGAKEKNVDQIVSSSVNSAIEVYNIMPGKPMLNYIRTLNPQAAEIIEANSAAKKAKSK